MIVAGAALASSCFLGMVFGSTLTGSAPLPGTTTVPPVQPWQAELEEQPPWHPPPLQP